MENDVRLLQQLLALGESIQELKSKNQTSSRVSLNSFDDEENEVSMQLYYHIYLLRRAQ